MRSEDCAASLGRGPWSVAVGELTAECTHYALRQGRHHVDEHTLFDVGSISKTVTATVLAELVLAGTVTLATRLGELLAITGGAAGVTLGQLATHTSGLPRLAPNWRRPPFDLRDPYASWGVEDLLSALTAVSPQPSTEAAYSNFGFQALGHALAVAAGTPLPALSVDLLRRAGCGEIRCGYDGSQAATVPGFGRRLPARTWTMQVYGPGGVRMSSTSLLAWAAAQTWPGTSALEDAVRLTQRPVIGDADKGQGLGWALSRGRVWHNGRTAAHTAELFIRPGVAAVGALVNSGKADVQQRVAARLAEIVSWRLASD